MKGFFIIRFLGANTKFYHTHDDCCKVDGKPVKEISDPGDLDKCSYCAQRDRKEAA